MDIYSTRADAIAEIERFLPDCTDEQFALKHEAELYNYARQHRTEKLLSVFSSGELQMAKIPESVKHVAMLALGSGLSLTEQKILAHVQETNDAGALAGLKVSPDDPAFDHPEHRFVKRLYQAGKLVWVKRTKKLGAGWAIPGHPIHEKINTGG